MAAQTGRRIVVLQATPLTRREAGARLVDTELIASPLNT